MAARPSTLAVAARPVRVNVVRAVPFQAVRMYSAGGALEKEAVEGRIMSLLQGFDKVNDTKNITPAAHFANDLGLDSLDTVEVVMAIEEEFSIEIPDKDADGIHSIEGAVNYILTSPMPLKWDASKWTIETASSSRLPATRCSGSTGRDNGEARRRGDPCTSWATLTSSQRSVGMAWDHVAGSIQVAPV